MLWDKLALTLAIVGALNWGSIGLFSFDLVAWICGGQTALLARIIYAAVGLAGIWCITMLFREDEETGHAPHTASIQKIRRSSGGFFLGSFHF